RVAGEMIDTGQGLQIVAKAQIIGVRAGVSLLRRTDHNDIGLDLHQVVVVQAPLAHGTTGKAVNDHIAQRHESFGNGHAFRMVKIQCNPVFAAVKIVKKAAAIDIRCVIAKVTAAREAQQVGARYGLDTNDFGAMVSEDFRANGCGPEPGEIEHTYAL